MNYVHVAKAFLIRQSDGRIVVLTRSDNKRVSPGRWEYSAGGLVDPGETPQQALLREMQEEIGMQTDVQYFGETKFFNPYTGKHDLMHLYVGGINKDIEWFDSNEVKAVDYFSIEEIKDLIEKHGADAFDLGYLDAFEQLQEHEKGGDK